MKNNFHIDKGWAKFKRDNPLIILDGIGFEIGLRSFKKRWESSGIIGQLKNRSRFPKPSDRRKQKQKNAHYRNMKKSK